MNKIIFLFFLYTFFIHSLGANEPTLAILKSIDSNSRQSFNIQKYNFYCEPYGVKSLENMQSISESGSKCKESIESFYKKNPDLKYFTDEILKTEQLYHIEWRENRCVLYAQGEKTLSELLLENGLAVNKRTFKDEEFKFLYEKAEQNAKFLKRGMWNGTIQKDCATEINKD